MLSMTLLVTLKVLVPVPLTSNDILYAFYGRRINARNGSPLRDFITRGSEFFSLGISCQDRLNHRNETARGLAASYLFTQL